MPGILPSSFVRYPAEYVVKLAQFISTQMNWLAREAQIGPLFIKDITRAMAKVMEAPVGFLKILLVDGIRQGRGANAATIVQPLSWLAFIGLVVLAGYRLNGWRLALFSLAGLLYLVIFGLWVPAMATLSGVLLSGMVSVGLGILIGTKAVKTAARRRAVESVLNVMQTVPVFSYLVPTLLFLGYGESASLFATVIYALPPMVHATMHALRNVPPEVVEYGQMAGATPRQIYWKIKLPVSLRLLAVGLNQTIMACLNMVIIGSMIGAGGLGYIVLVALRKLDIGSALEAGVAIVILAILLDRFSQELATGSALATRHALPRRFGWVVLSWLVLATALSYAFPVLGIWPKTYAVTTAPMWNAAVSWINLNLFDQLDAIRTATLLYVMIPVKEFLLAAPWLVVVALIGIAGLALEGMRLALGVMALMTFVAMTGYWEPAMVSIYLVGIAVIISLLVGMPLGYLASSSASVRAATNILLDTLQTLPTLVYILPAVMVFRNGDFSAVLAILSYSVPPAIRYTMHGFANVPSERLEAAAMSGATRWQTFKWVRLNAAFPTLILGINQTVMMAIAMLVITALIGTKDLGQQVFIALSRAKVGEGIVGGLCVAAIALACDALLKAWARRKARENGMIAEGV
ncbi:hypothetical protein ACO34A_26290 (plasmid) [Rhizobium sp. ACO-34A]|nr:hypothetical protein ACO34A_26290 [Rhizobium sp. ACO-34A]